MHGGMGGRTDFIVGGGSHIVIAIGGVLKRETRQQETKERMSKKSSESLFLMIF